MYIWGSAISHIFRILPGLAFLDFLVSRGTLVPYLATVDIAEELEVLQFVAALGSILGLNK